MNYQEVLDFLYTQLPMYQRVGKVAFKKDLTNTLRLSEALDHPHLEFNSIHVAGTNGKGSTSHMIASVLQSAGYKTGLYTSPHLKSFRERIRVNGEEVSEDFITDFIHRHKAVIEKIAPSFFEITVVMAFAYFAKQQVDYAVIETGLGGRLDSTNIITPVLSVITSISMDHQDMLGDTLEDIAREKAGIIKSDVPVVTGRLPALAMAVIQKCAREKRATCIAAQKTERQPVSDISPNVVALNVSTVEAAIHQLQLQGARIDEKHIARGIRHVASTTGLKGRWQLLNKHPMVICDVGHNEEAVQWLMKEIQQVPYRQLHIVWGVVEGKSIENILPLLIKSCEYYFCAAKVPRAMAVDRLIGLAKTYGLSGHGYASVAEAYEAAVHQAHPDDLIFIGGSTFVVAEIKEV